MKKELLLILTLICCFTAVSAQNSPYISRVIEYRPAPGQHINRIFPTADMSTSPEKALEFAQKQLLSQKPTSQLGLGGYGGYVIVAFDHPVVNVKDSHDMRTTGNNMYVSNTEISAMAEPGIVMVCQDLNKNGKPDLDEPWYELAGSEYNNPETIHNYEITYYRPDPDGQKSNIKWADNQGNEGEVKHIQFAFQNTMYPLWITENTMTFRGTKLPDNIYKAIVEYNGQETTVTAQKNFPWGYADNNVNDYDADLDAFTEPIETTGVDIDWAVDAEGNPVHLDYIDFVKIYTGQLQQNDLLGETSTELGGMGGIIDLHPDAVLATAVTNPTLQDRTAVYIWGNNLVVKSPASILSISIFNINGQKVADANAKEINIQNLSKGVYIVQINTSEGIVNKKINK